MNFSCFHYEIMNGMEIPEQCFCVVTCDVYGSQENKLFVKEYPIVQT